ncbi:hypothetical protein LTR53_004988 [Teratosphaeriaceae sp. CCFEE 6253]|nr:hypothetical protein LTR53_004988 [Teratosphaeriaceae sp. CCFEE 6253]
MAGLQIRPMSDDFAGDVECILGEEHPKLCGRDNKYGYLCERCKIATRRAAGKKSRAGRHLEGSSTPFAGPTSASGSRTRGRADRVHHMAPRKSAPAPRKPAPAPLSYGGQSAEAYDTAVSQDMTTEVSQPGRLHGTPAQVAEEKAFYASLTQRADPNSLKEPDTVPGPGQSSKPRGVPLKAAPSAASHTADVASKRPWAKSAGTAKGVAVIIVHEASGTYSQKSIVPRRAEADDPVQQWMNSIEPPRVSCSCEGGSRGTFHDYIICKRCPNIQHKACIPTAAADPVGRGSLCKACRGARLQKMFRRHHQRTLKAGLDSREVRKKADAARRVRDEKLRAVVARHFWKAYCDLPPGKASVTTLELTGRFFNSGRMMPMHPAPAGWVDEVVACIDDLVCPANRALVMQVMGRDQFAFSLSRPDKLLRGLGRLAVLKLHHGSPRGTKAGLRVLAEVIGLEERGTYWDG